MKPKDSLTLSRRYYLLLIILLFLISIPLQYALEVVIDPDMTTEQLQMRLIRMVIRTLLISGCCLFLFRFAWRELTKRQDLERQLDQSKLWYQLVAEVSTDFAYIIRITPDRKINIEWGSVPIDKFVNLAIDDLKEGSAWESFVHRDDIPLAQQAMEQLLAGQATVLECRFISNKQEIIWVRNHCRPQWDAAQQVVERVLVVGQDITAAKLVEQQLRKSEEQNRAVISALAEGVVVHDANGTIVSYNESAYRILGMSATYAEGQKSIDPLWQAIHEDGSPFPAEEHPAMVSLKTGQPFSNVVMGLGLPDREILWISINTQPVFHPDESKPYGVVASFVDITERKLQEEQLRENNRLLEENQNFIRRLNEATPEIISILDLTTQRYVYNNKQALKVLGYDEDKNNYYFDTFRAFLSLIHPEDLPGLMAQGGSFVEATDQEVFEAEFRMLHADGEWRWFSTRSVVFARSPEGAVTQVIGASREITRRKKVEAELAEQRDFAMQVVNLMGQGLTVTDDQERIQFANPAILKMVGATLEDVIGKYPMSFIMQEDHEVLSEAREKRADGESNSYELKMKSADGQGKYVLVTGSPLLRDGKWSGSIAVITDLSERQQMEKELRESENRYRELFAEALRQAAILEMLHRVRTSLNRVFELPALTETVTKAIAEAFGFSHVSIYLVEGDKLVLSNQYGFDASMPVMSINEGLIGLAARTGKPILVEDVNTHPDYLRVLDAVSEICIPLFDRDNLVGVLNVESTGNKVFTDKEFAMLQTLSQQVNQAIERSRLYTELVMAREEALSASRLKSEFLANMSHEIRTPLNAIISSNELIRDTALNEQQQDLVAVTRNSADLLLQLLNDILDISKIEANKLVLENIDFEPVRLVEETLDLFKPKAAEKGIKLLSFIEFRPGGWLRGDPTRLRQVLMNLLSNAVKFTERGEILVRVTRVRTEDRQLKLQFEVSDSGIGISRTAQLNLFQSFSQADSSTTRRYGGTGLGLSISQRLVALMGGQIEVESEEKLGSTFRFVLPFQQGRLPTGTLPAPKENLPKLVVLVASSTRKEIEILEKYMNFWGMEVETVSSGQQALKRMYQGVARQKPFDLAIVDYNLPDLNCIQLAHLIRQDETFNETRLVSLTNLDQVKKVSGANLPEFDSNLIRPVHQSHFLDCLVKMASPIISDIKAIKPVVTEKALLSGKHRILLVEDNPVNQKLSVMQLQKLGYHVDLASNGEEALKILNENCYDLILMDCQMPLLDGFETTRLIRQRENRQGGFVPIVALTAGSMLEERERGLAAGMNDYLVKPVTLEQLEKVLQRWIPEKIEAAPAFVFASHPASDGVSSVAEDDPSVLDPQVLGKLRSAWEGSDPGQVNKIIDLFLKNSPGWFKELEDAIYREQAGEIAKLAHRLRGSSLSLGARTFPDVCRKLELCGNAGDVKEALAMQAEASQAFLALCQALVKMVVS